MFPTDLVARLKCPYTGSPFELEMGNGHAIEYGVLRSQGGRFPIISGVLRLLIDELRAPLVDLITKGHEQDALRGALEVPVVMRRGVMLDRLWSGITQRLPLDAAVRTGTPGKRRLYKRITRSHATFRELAAEVDSGAWAKWQTLRFSMPTFLPVYALAHMARGRRTILDFGCGLGHSAFLMKRLSRDAQVICADYSFTSMYLARRYIAVDAACICLDGDYPLPFAAHYFDCIFSTDALQYIEAKIGLAREFERSLSSDGVITLAHLHNRLSPVVAGSALTASGYDGLFEGMQRRLYPEDTIVSDYVASGTLNLGRQCTPQELNQALSGLSLVAARTDAIFTSRAGLLDAYIEAMRHPELNPAYEITQEAGALTLKRGIGALYAVERTIESCKILPLHARVQLPSPGSADILARREADRDGLRELVRRFLVLETPDLYW